MKILRKLFGQSRSDGQVPSGKQLGRGRSDGQEPSGEQLQTIATLEIKKSYILQLRQAVDKNDLQNARLLMDKGTNPDWVLSTGSVMSERDRNLFRAVEKNHLEMTQLLLHYGASADSGRLLHIAVSHCSPQMVELLISHGADVNARFEGGTYLTCLIEKVFRKIPCHHHKVNHLLSVSPLSAATPIFSAFHRRSGSTEMLECLLARGADLNATATLLERDPNAFFNIEQFWDHTLLHYAAAKGSNQVVEFLLSKGVNVDVMDKDGHTPLAVACRNSQKSVVDLLISNGANLNVRDRMSTPLLHFAAMGESKEIVELLITAGADVNARNDYAQTPLHLAAAKGSKEIVELLLIEGADVNAKINWKNWYSTGLHLATPLYMCDRREVAELLIANGADLNTKNALSQTPLANATKRGFKEIAALLTAEDPSAKPSDHLYTAVANGDIAMVELLLSGESRVRTEALSKPMHRAIEGLALGEKRKIAEILLARGADVNVKDLKGNTPLHYAAARCSLEEVKFLLTHGADVNAENRDGRSPLFHARDSAARGRTGSEAMVKYLLANDAK